MSLDECGTPASIPFQPCSQIGSCSYKQCSTGTLHKLDNPIAPLKTVGSDGRCTYYYNPCSGIQLHTEGGDCHYVEKTFTMIMPVSLHWLVSAQPSSVMIISQYNTMEEVE